MITPRQQRGINLAERRFGEIEKCGGFEQGLWRVPSECFVGVFYEVDPKDGSCSCHDAQFGPGFACKHLWAARYVRDKSATCADCSRRYWLRDLVEVTEDHDSLTWCEGDLLCDTCVEAHGGIT